MMIRTFPALAFFLLTTLTVSPFAQSAVRDPHLRSVEVELIADLEIGVRVSPTFRQLVARLEASDIVVYLMFDGSLAPHTDGHVSLMAMAGGRRYLRLSIDRHTAGCQRLAILGHELQHAIEALSEPGVRSTYDFVALFQRIGVGNEGRYETKAAVRTGVSVERQACGPRSAR